MFLEYWKRESIRLAYIWDVQEYEANEPDRPEFFGTKGKTVTHISKFILRLP